MAYKLEGLLLSASRRQTKEGQQYAIAEVMIRDDRGHRVVPCYLQYLDMVEELVPQVGQQIEAPVRLYVNGGQIKTVMLRA